MITVELFGIARARAGSARVEVEARTLGEALAALVRACPGLEPEVVLGGALTEHYVVSRNGEEFVTQGGTRLAEGETLLILGAQAGG
ncbi:MAG: MoaD/ThiS family protein [Planctomycetaceae bacterium]